MLAANRAPVTWHAGEHAVQELLGVAGFWSRNPTNRGLAPHYAERVEENALLGVGTLDAQGRPWCTLWGGYSGYAKAKVDSSLVEIRTMVDGRYDPVVQALFPFGEPSQKKPLMAAISLDLETLDRVKIMGFFSSGALTPYPQSLAGELRLRMKILESLGNCPKYINTRHLQPHRPSPTLVSESLPLPQEAVDLIHKADIFFLSSTNGESMDCNHRGGPSGFVRVASNALPSADASGEGGVVLVYPEYSGNRTYQTLGNLALNDHIGLVFPDFDNGSALYLTGRATLLIGPDALSLMPHQKLAVKIEVHEARFVHDSLPFRGTLGPWSPYNPPVRPLASEGALDGGQPSALAMAELVKREKLTSSITRFTFKLHAPDYPDSCTNRDKCPPVPVNPWHPGQYATFDFSVHLDRGYKHMNDADPASLNDDYVRTFTISKPLPAGVRAVPVVTEVAGDQPRTTTQPVGLEDGTELEITTRQHGPVTKFLNAYPLTESRKSKRPLLVPVTGFGGKEEFRLPFPPTVDGGAVPTALHEERTRPIFIGSGVGITPLLAQAEDVLAAEKVYASRKGAEPVSGLEVLWTLRADDLPLAIDSFEKIPDLAARTTLYVTQYQAAGKKGDELVKRATDMGAMVEIRRLTKEDVLQPGKAKAQESPVRNRYYICAGAEVTKLLAEWLKGQEVHAESFAY